MALDDEAEKLRQAEEWVKSPSTPDQAVAAAEYIAYVLHNTRRDDLRVKAFQILQQVQNANAVGRL